MSNQLQSVTISAFVLAAVVTLAAASAAPCAFELQGEGRATEVTDARSFRLQDGRDVRLGGIEPAFPAEAEAAAEAARRAAQPPRTLFAIGFLTGYEMDWLPPVMEILRAELPNTEVVVHSQDSPDLAAGLVHGKIDLAFLRPEKQAPGLKFRLLRKDPLIVLMPCHHALAARNAIRPQDIAGQTLIGVSPVRAPTTWAAINDYLKPLGVKPDHQAENLAMAISLVASTGGISLLPLYSQNLLPNTVVSRPMRGTPPTVDLVIGYNEANTSPLLKFILTKVDDLKFRVTKSGSR